MRALWFGITAGLTLSALRAPLGLDLLSIPARTAASAYGYRAAALALVALGLLVGGPALDGRRGLARVAVGATLGLALHALWIGRMPETPAGAMALGWIALGVLVFCGRIAHGRRGAPPAAPVGPQAEGGPLAGEATGLAIAGAGLALVLEGLARHLRLLGPGLPAEDGLLAGVLLALAVFGGAAFGRLVPDGPPAALGRAAFLGAAGLGGILGLAVLRRLATPGPLHDYVDSFGLDLSRAGMADFTALVGAAVLVGSAMSLGAALFCLEARRQLAALALGAATGLTLIPRLLELELPEGASPLEGLGGSRHSAALVSSGTLVALLGAGLCAAFASRAPRPARAAALVLAAAAGFAVHRTEVAAIPITRPWREQPQAPLLSLEIPEGLLAIERSEGGLEQVTLDGRELTPPTARGALERRCLELSFALLPPARLAAEDLRVLLVGQLTPGRALALGELGATRIDRTGAWHRAMPLLERRLFRAVPAVPGRVVDPGTARRELLGGGYDLVLVLGAAGEAPTTRNLASPSGTLTVVWLDGADDLAGRSLGRVLVSTDLENLALGLAHGAQPRTGGPPAPGAPAFLDAGVPLRAIPPASWLGLRRHERALLSQRRLTRRLAEARGGDGAAIQALARHFEVQRHSSPYETRAQRIELEPAAMDRVRDAAMEAPLTSLAVDLAESLAQVLAGKRWADEVRDLLAAPADRHRPWPTLEKVLAYAHIEALQPLEAARRLEDLLALDGGDAEVWALLGEARYQGARAAEAARAYSRALELAPGSNQLQRYLAMALVRAGDPLGRDLVRELLLEDPGDEELRPYLGTAPLPPLPRGYRPLFGDGSSSHLGYDHRDSRPRDH